MYDYTEVFNKTKQTEAKMGKDQVQNSAGGYVYSISDNQYLMRFLILGTEGNTYYQNSAQLSKDNITNILRIIKEDAKYVVDTTVEVSASGRSIKNDTCIFVLAAVSAFADEGGKNYANSKLKDVVRTGGHMLMFAHYRDAMGGWGRSLRKAVADWYNSHSDDALEYQVAKYRQRNGWTHLDILRLAHVKPDTARKNALFAYLAGKGHLTSKLFTVISDLEDTDYLAHEVCRIIRNNNLSREMIPTKWLSNPKVQAELLKNMPITATIRNLGAFTASGALNGLNDSVKIAVSRVTDDNVIKRGRVHPMQFALAYKTYLSGGGFRGNLKWVPTPSISKALEAGLEKSFSYVEPSGKNFYIGLDVSGSMGMAINNTNITCAEGAAIIAKAIVCAEDWTIVKGFCNHMKDIGIAAGDSLSQVLRKTYDRTFGSTDCALPMLDAIKCGYDNIDCFVVITDNETWAGNVHPSEALEMYNKRFNRQAKLVVVGMTATRFSIAEPNNPLMLDVVGFDANIPALISEFAKI